MFRPSPQRFASRPPQSVSLPDYHDGQPEWEVETILRIRGTPGRRRFLVKWANTTQKQILPQESLTRCPYLLKEYYERNNLSIPADIQDMIDYPDDKESEAEPETMSQDGRQPAYDEEIESDQDSPS